MSSAAKDGTILQRLADRVVGFDSEQLTPKAKQQIRSCITDALGVTLAGVSDPSTAILLDVPGIAAAPGPCLIFGTSRRTSALDAALVNGTAAHALDYDDFSAAMGGHPTVTLAPMLLALGEERHASGLELMTAFAVGIEVEIRLARAVNFHHYDKGWHPTSTLGVFGAAAAAARMLELDSVRTATALAIAASMASGIKANFGTMTKPLHVGRCGRDGLFAALLAERGFDAAHDAMEHFQGFLNVFNGPGTFDTGRIFDGWASPLEIEAPDIGLKQFPCCGSTHAAVFAMLELKREFALRSEMVEAIEIKPHRRRLRHTNNPRPQTAKEAKFSVQYACARALKDGVLRVSHFEGDAPANPEIVRLLEVTRAVPHPGMAEDGPEQWGAEVVVALKDGRHLARRIDNLVGRSAANPMSPDEIWDKFADCAERAMPHEQVAALFERLQALDAIEDVAALVALMERPDATIRSLPGCKQK